MSLIKDIMGILRVEVTEAENTATKQLKKQRKDSVIDSL